MALLITNIPPGARLFIAKRDNPKEVVFNEIVNSQVLEFETEREDNGQTIIIRTAAKGYLPFETEVVIRPTLISVMLDPKEDLLYRRDGH